MGIELIALGLLGGAASLYFINSQPGGIGGLLSGFGLGGLGGGPAAAAAVVDPVVPEDVAKGETPDPEPIPATQYASIYPMLVPTFYPVQRIIYYVNLYRPRCPGIYWADDDILEALLDYRHDLDDIFDKHRRHIDIDDLARALSLRVYPYFCDPWRFRTIRIRKWYRWPHFHVNFYRPEFRRRWDQEHHNPPPGTHPPPPTTPPHTPPPTTPPGDHDGRPPTTTPPPPHTPLPTTPPETPPPTTTPPPPAGHPRPYKWGQDGRKGPRSGDMPGQSDAPTSPTAPAPPLAPTTTTAPPAPIVTAPSAPSTPSMPAPVDDTDTNDGEDTGVPATTNAPAVVKPGDTIKKSAATPNSRPFKAAPLIKRARLGWGLDYV